MSNENYDFHFVLTETEKNLVLSWSVIQTFSSFCMSLNNSEFMFRSHTLHHGTWIFFAFSSLPFMVNNQFGEDPKIMLAHVYKNSTHIIFNFCEQ